MDGLDWLLFDAEGRLRIAWRFFLFGLAFFAAILLGGVAATLALVAWAAAAPRPADDLLSAYLAEAMLLYAACITPPIVAVTAACRRWLDRRSLASMGLGWPKNPLASFLGGTAIGVALILLAALIVSTWGGFRIEQGNWSLAIVALLIALGPLAFIEEIVVRGYLLQNLLDARRPVLGVIFTSSVFWLLHGLNDHAWSQPLISLNLFLAGVLLGLAYIGSGNLWFPTALHYGWNACQGPILGIPVSGMKVPSLWEFRPLPDQPVWLTGGKFGLEGSAIVTGLQVVLCALFLCWIWRNRAALPVPIEAPPDIPCGSPQAPSSTANPYAS